jgi:hypothetical protein
MRVLWKRFSLIFDVQWTVPHEAGRSETRPVNRAIKVFWLGPFNLRTVTSVSGVSVDSAHLARSGGLLIQALTKQEVLF